MDIDRAMRRLAATQHGSLGWRQARELGADGRCLRRRVQRGDRERPSPLVLRRAGAPRTFRQRCAEGVLDVSGRAVASHLTAAALLGLPGFR
ncbi:MAG: hypothetical protein H0U89_11230 [Acidimicrobiia bacterium]|nr:hypothetical protein [Acidimicrobiia bacterium]